MSDLIVKSISGEYKIIIEEGSFQKLSLLVEGKYKKVLIVTDHNVNYYHKASISSLQKRLKALLILLSPGEKSKSSGSFNKIVNILSAERFTRDSLIIAIGGGVVGDLSGFAASIYMRGINLIHVPTTLLSCVDSSVGGKTGINYNNIKNLIGTFYNPVFVLADPSFLTTLPDKEFNSGMGEVIKYAFLAGGEIYKKAFSLNLVTKEDTAEICRIITNCLSFKSSIIRRDEKDKGIRQLLNFGHTFAHAYESASGFRLKHGIAVAYGISSSLFLSEALHLINKTERDEYLKVPEPFLPGKHLKFNEKDIFNYMLLDKKNKTGNMNFVLLKKPGMMLTNVTAQRKDILSSIKKTFML